MIKRTKAYILFGLLIIGLVAFYFQSTGKLPTEQFTEQVCEKIKKRCNIEDGYIIFVDYSKASCTNRMAIYDVNAEEYIYCGKVLHGKGRSSTPSKPEFSNEIGSKCSSLGLFKVQEYGRMQRIDIPCFRLIGLDKTNNNALKRGILIHPCVTASLLPIELSGVNFPLTPESEGCFSVSFWSFIKIRELAEEKKPIYIYSYYGE